MFHYPDKRHFKIPNLTSYETIYALIKARFPKVFVEHFSTDNNDIEITLTTNRIEDYFEIGLLIGDFLSKLTNGVK